MAPDGHTTKGKEPEAEAGRVPFDELELGRYSPRAQAVVALTRVAAGSRPSRLASSRSLLAALLAPGPLGGEGPSAADWLLAELDGSRDAVLHRLAAFYPAVFDAARTGLTRAAVAAARERQGREPLEGSGLAAVMTRDLAGVFRDAETLAADQVGVRHLVGALLAEREGEPSNAFLLLNDAGADLARLRAAFGRALARWSTHETPDARRRLLVDAAPSEAARAPVAAVSTLADLPLESDLDDTLEFGPCADALAGLIDDPKTGTPLTIAINAPWGAGKSSLAKMIARRLASKPAVGAGLEPVVLWFNAWLHDDAPNLGTALASFVTRELARQRRVRTRIAHPLPRALWSPGQRTALFLSVVTALTAAIAFSGTYWGALRDVFLALFGDSAVAKGVAGAGGIASVLGFAKASSTTAGAVAKFVADPDRVANFGNISHVRAELERLTREARRGSRRIVIFIDDLERCQPPRGVDLLEIVNQLLNHPGVVVVILADMPAIAAAADIKYQKLAEHYNPAEGTIGKSGRGYGRLYLQKIVQLEFDVPPHAPPRLRALMQRLAKPPEPPRARESTRPADPWSSFWTTWKEYLLPDRRELGLVRFVKRYDEVTLTALKLAALPEGVPSSEARAVRARVAVVLYAVATLLGVFAALTYLRYTIFGARAFDLLGASVAGALVLTFVQHRRARVSPGRELSIMLALGILAFGGTHRLVGWLLDVTRPLPVPHAYVLSALLPAQLLAGLGPLVVVGAALALGEEAVRRIAAAWARRLIDARLAAHGTEAPVKELLPDVEATLPQAELEALVSERRTLRLLDDQHVLNEAYDEVADYLGRFPRSTKRFVNQVRVLVRIAGERGALAGEPALTPRHFGRWVTLRERWPALASALYRNPARAAELEALVPPAHEPSAAPGGELDELRRVLGSWAAEDNEADEIARFFARDALKLGPVAERLLHLVPSR